MGHFGALENHAKFMLPIFQLLLNLLECVGLKSRA